MKKILTLLASILLCCSGLTAKSKSDLDYAKEISKMMNLIKKADGIVSYASSLEYGFFLILPDDEYYYKNIPDSMETQVKKIKASKERILDVNITDEGLWTIITDSSAYTSDGVPEEMYDELEMIAPKGEYIRCLSVNDSGEYAIVTNRQYSSNSSLLTQELMDSTIEKYGMLRYIYVGNGYVVITCDNGIHYESDEIDYPNTFVDNVEKTKIPLKRGKIFSNKGYVVTSKDNTGYVQFQFNQF